jgi:phage terminase large subunit
LVREKAESLATSLGEESFKVSSGWFERFKKRENIVFKKLHGEAAEADTVSRDEWLEQQWVRMRQEYSEESIWNADETGIYSRALPDGTLTFKSDNKRGGKKIKRKDYGYVRLLCRGRKEGTFCHRKKSEPPLLQTRTYTACSLRSQC